MFVSNWKKRLKWERNWETNVCVCVQAILSHPNFFFFTLQAFIYYCVIFSKAWWNLVWRLLSSLSTRLRMKVYNHDDERKPLLSVVVFIHVKKFPQSNRIYSWFQLALHFLYGLYAWHRPDIPTKSIKHSMKGLKKESIIKSINNTSQHLQSFVLISFRSQLLSFHKIRGKQSNAARCIWIRWWSYRKVKVLFCGYHFGTDEKNADTWIAMQVYALIFCRQTRWSRSRWRHPSTSLQTQNGLLSQSPEKWMRVNKALQSTWLFLIQRLSKSGELTVDSPNTLSFFSWLLCSIFPPPRHLHSIPKASMAGWTFSNIWSANNPNHSINQNTAFLNLAVKKKNKSNNLQYEGWQHCICFVCAGMCAHVCRIRLATDCKWVNSALTAATIQLICIFLVWRTWRSPAADYTTATINLLWYCTFCASDYVFIRIAVFHFHSDQYVLKGSLWIDLHIGDFSQSVCHCACSCSDDTGDTETAHRSAGDRQQHGALSHMPVFGWHVRFLS